MGQHDSGRPERVAHGIHAGEGGAHVLIGPYPAPPVHGDPGFGQPEPGGIGRAPHRDQHGFGFDGRFLHLCGRGLLDERRRAERGPDHAALHAHVLERPAQLAADAAFLHFPLEQRAHVRIHGRQGQQAVLAFHHRDLGPEGLIDERQFAADDAPAHDGDGRGHPVERQRVVAGQDMRMIDGQAGKFQRARTRSEDHAVALDGNRAFGCGGFHQPGMDEAPPPLEEPDAEARASLFEPAAQGGADLFLAGQHGGGVHSRSPLPGDAELGQAQGQLQRVGGGFQRLGGDAAVVQAGSAEVPAFHEGHGHPGAGGGKGGRVPAGASPDDGQAYGHGAPPSPRRIRDSDCISPGRPLRASP